MKFIRLYYLKNIYIFVSTPAAKIIILLNITFDNNIDYNKFSEAHLYWTVLTAIVSKMF